MKRVGDTVSKKYGKALVLAMQPADLDRFIDTITAIIPAVTGSDFKRFIADPSLPKERKLALINDLASAIDGAGKDAFFNLCTTLDARGRLATLDSVLQSTLEFYRALKAALVVEIKSARELTQDEKAKMQAMIQTKFGKLPTITWGVDSELIGGTVIKVGDNVADYSVLNSLRQASKILLEKR